MGNLYTDNLIGTVIGLSVADDWEGARREWEIVGCEVDETHSATCVCGKEGLRYVYTIANTETGETLSPIGSSCIKKFEQSDMDEELAGWQQAIKLMEEAARIGKEDYVHLHSGSYSRKLLNVQKAQAGSSMELILSSQLMGTRGGDTSGSWFPGEPETPQKRHGKGCGGTPFSMPFLLSH